VLTPDEAAAAEPRWLKRAPQKASADTTSPTTPSTAAIRPRCDLVPAPALHRHADAAGGHGARRRRRRSGAAPAGCVAPARSMATSGIGVSMQTPAPGTKSQRGLIAAVLGVVGLVVVGGAFWRCAA